MKSDSSEVVAAESQPLKILVIPVGSWEQHGPHLPFDTDTRIASALSANLIATLPHSQLGPAVTVTASGEHAGFPGTLSIGTETTAQLLIEIARSATWAEGIVFVNGHGGNHDAVQIAQRACIDEGRRVLFWSPPPTDDRDTHAGHCETSVMLVLAPDLVRTELFEPGVQTPIAELWPKLRSSGVLGVSPNGILGDPRTANADDGRQLLNTWTNSLCQTVNEWLWR